MSIKVVTETGTKVVNSIRMMTAPGTVKRVRRIRIMDTGDVLRTIFAGFDPITATISPSSFFVAEENQSTISENATAIVTGGVAPYTYIWSVVSNSGTLPVITSPATASPTFTQYDVASGETETAVFRVSVTDAIGQSATADLPAQFNNQKSR